MLKDIFKRKTISFELQEFKKAGRLFTRLSRLHIIKVIILLLFIIFIAPIIIFYIYRPKVQTDINYGVTFSNKYAQEIGLDWKIMYLAMLDDLNTKNLRLVVYWDDAEKIKDKYNFADIIWQLNEAEKRDVNVILAIGRKVPRYPECFEPEWWKNIDQKEVQDIELLEYLKGTVGALKDFKSIKIWQVENEPFFKFGECKPEVDSNLVKKEIDLVRSLDPRPILVQDSGEGGFWYPSYKLADYLGISMYRKVWYDFWHVFFGNFIYFKYPLAHWTYKIKSELTLVPHDKIIVTELQAEPWGPGINSKLTQKEKDKTMSRHDFMDTITYAQKAGFKDLYFWGVEWWYWEKYVNKNPYYWDTAKALFN